MIEALKYWLDTRKSKGRDGITKLKLGSSRLVVSFHGGTLCIDLVGNSQVGKLILYGHVDMQINPTVPEDLERFRKLLETQGVRLPRKLPMAGRRSSDVLPAIKKWLQKRPSKGKDWIWRVAIYRKDGTPRVQVHGRGLFQSTAIRTASQGSALSISTLIRDHIHPEIPEDFGRIPRYFEIVCGCEFDDWPPKN